MGPWCRRLAQEITKWGLDNRHDDARGWLRAAEFGLLSEGQAEMLLRSRCHSDIEQLKLSGNFLARPPKIEEMYPDELPPIVVGHLSERSDVPVGMSLSGAVHSVISGTTGAGKSVKIRRDVYALEHMKEATGRRTSVMLLDRKPDYPDLPGRFPNWHHYDWYSTLRVGLQPPQGVPVDVWINHVVSIFCARAGLIAAWVPLANMMRWLVAAMNPDPVDRLVFPTFAHILDLARRVPATTFADKTAYMGSLTTSLEAVTQGSGDLFQTTNGLDLERDLVSQGLSAVVHMPQVSPIWLGLFVADLFVTQLLVGRSFRGQFATELEGLFIIDEADDDVSTKNEQFFSQGLMPIARAFRQLRGFGIGVTVGVGNVGPISQHVLNAATYQFFFKMDNAADAEKAGRTLQIPPRSYGMFKNLKPGQAIVHTPAWPDAFLAQIENAEPHAGVTPNFDTNPHVASKPLDDMPGVPEAIQNLMTEHRRGVARRAAAKHAGLHPKARELLYAAASHPFMPVARLYDKIGTPSPETQKSIRATLAEEEYAHFAEIRAGRRNLLLIELQERAWKLLGKPPIPLRGRGGIAHRSIAAWLAEVAEREGFDAHVEWLLPGTKHPVDVAWHTDRGFVCIEVIVDCDENLAQHLRTIPEHGTEIVCNTTIVAVQDKKLKEIKKRIDQISDLVMIRDSVSYVSVATILKELNW